MALKNKIEKKKKELWDKYTGVVNANFDAFELVRNIGILQGKAEVEKIVDEYLEPDYPNEHSDVIRSVMLGIKQRINKRDRR